MTITIGIPRNGDFYREWQLLDYDEQPIDLTGHTLEMDAREIAGDGTVLASAVISIIEPANGIFTVRWRGEDFDGYGERTAVARAASDLKHTYPDGVRDVYPYCLLEILPESTE